MKLNQTVNAYMAVLELSVKDMDYKTAYALVRLKRKLKPHADFFLAEEKKLMEEYAAKDEKGQVIFATPHTFQFRDPAQMEEYNTRHKELEDVEVQEEFSPWRVSAPKSIRPAHLEALEGLLDFGAPEGSGDA